MLRTKNNSSEVELIDDGVAAPHGVPDIVEVQGLPLGDVLRGVVHGVQLGTGNRGSVYSFVTL